MAIEDRNKLQILNRRAIVSSLNARGLTTPEIADRLAEQGFSGVSLAVINNDIAEVAKMWKKECFLWEDDRRSRQLMEINEVKRAAWEDRDLEVVLKCIKQEIDLLGTKKADVDNKNSGARIIDGELIDTTIPVTKEKRIREIAEILIGSS